MTAREIIFTPRLNLFDAVYLGAMNVATMSGAPWWLWLSAVPVAIISVRCERAAREAKP